ncbi:MAG: hypothetical protein E3J94_08560 [Desulfobacteraceae bacterium]|nr:MAG: hypothetical protein E3J94_08560 [Desulfobacteraceae bacterium]
MIQLPEEKYIQIDEKLPISIFDLQHKVLQPNIDLLLAATVHDLFTNQKNPETKIDIAAVCLRDSVDVACDVVYALRKAYENLIWYREQDPDAPKEMEACRFAKFFADDAALRLYASGEHIAHFLIHFLDIPADNIRPYKKSNASISSAVGKYLNATSDNQDISQHINSLLNEGSWQKTIDYRNHWVHEQPPLMEGQGIVYERKSRLKKTEKGYSVGITLGDKPKYTIDSLLSMVTSATNDFVRLLENLAPVWFNHIDSLGIKIK